MSDAIKLDYQVDGTNFSRAGEASGDVKRTLKKLGVSADIVRKVAIAMYEGEINMVIHGGGGEISVEISPEAVDMALVDHGKGIADIELAMQEGYSTATETIRNLGFGAGMGLPNIKKNTDEMQIISALGEGTTLNLKVLIKK